jgi:hypothetical protein
MASERCREVRQGSNFPAQKFIHSFVVELDVPCRDINLLSLGTTTSTIAFVEAGGAIKILLELMELDVVIPGSDNRKCSLNVVELVVNTGERTF